LKIVNFIWKNNNEYEMKYFLLFPFIFFFFADVLNKIPFAAVRSLSEVAWESKIAFGIKRVNSRKLLCFSLIYPVISVGRGFDVSLDQLHACICTRRRVAVKMCCDIRAGI
jgi:hypothetical protein